MENEFKRFSFKEMKDIKSCTKEIPKDRRLEFIMMYFLSGIAFLVIKDIIGADTRFGTYFYMSAFMSAVFLVAINIYKKEGIFNEGKDILPFITTVASSFLFVYFFDRLYVFSDMIIPVKTKAFFIVTALILYILAIYFLLIILPTFTIYLLYHKENISIQTIMNAICISLKYSLIIIKFNLSFILEYLLIALTFWIAGLYLIPNILVAHAELIKRINEIENEELDEIQSDF